jgi:peptide/nickel transport system substrate-binding protein
MTTKGYEYFAPHQWLELNNRVKPMDDKRFRQAIAHALDLKSMAARVYFGLPKQATGPVSSKTKFYEKDVKRYDYSIEKAKALLDEMGLKPGPDGKRVTLKYLIPPYGEVYQRAGEFIRQSLGRAGIDIQLENTDVGGWADKFSNWDYEMTGNLVYQYGDPALGVSRTYISSNIKKGILFSNTAGYSNPEVDKLFDEAASTVDETKRQELYSKVQKILVEDVPVVWMFEAAYPTFIDKRLKNVTSTGVGVHESFSSVYFG